MKMTKRRFKMVVEASFFFAISLAATFVLLVAAVDAYEYEQTGSCRDCIVLHKVRGW